jgi:hypothetical protein
MATATLPGWMRTALFATAAMNLLAGLAFLPPAAGARALAGMPPGEHAVYLSTVALFVLLFGVGYLWVAVANRPERLFITLAAVGKLSFFVLLVAFWATGALPGTAPLAGAADLLFAVLFFRWLAT